VVDDDDSRLAALADRINFTGIGPVARRYFVSNGFDGTLTSVGVVVSAYLSNVDEGFRVIQIGLGAGVGLLTSGVWSVWEIERAEMRAERLEIEEAMLTDLGGTQVEREKLGARKTNAFMSGLGPFIGLVLPLIPFLFEDSVSLLGAVLISIAIAVGVLFVFGAYMGSISRQRWYVAGARMGVAGLVVAVLNLFLPGG
jgi:predicted membrane protein (TIGR00267 family)